MNTSTFTSLYRPQLLPCWYMATIQSIRRNTPENQSINHPLSLSFYFKYRMNKIIIVVIFLIRPLLAILNHNRVEFAFLVNFSLSRDLSRRERMIRCNKEDRLHYRFSHWTSKVFSAKCWQVVFLAISQYLLMDED